MYICFPVALTGVWQEPASGPLGALGRWTTAIRSDGTAAVTSASPMAHLKAGRLVRSSDPDALDHIPFEVGDQDRLKISNAALFKAQFFGSMSGTMGATSALLILIGGVYLFWTKAASRTTILGGDNVCCIESILFWLKVEPVPGSPAVLGGSFAWGVFMATDPSLAPNRGGGGFSSGFSSACNRGHPQFFHLQRRPDVRHLVGQYVAAIIDYGVKAWQDSKKTKARTEAAS